MSNQLLAALSASDYKRLLPKLEQFTLTYGENIYQPNEIISHVFFPISGIISLLIAIESGSMLEVGIIGKEGIIGLAVFLGVKISNNRAIVQGKGIALRMKTEDFLTECENSAALTRILKRFTQSLLVQVSQSAVCYRFHQVEERLARWLLMTSDRMESDKFQITQDFLSNMLGVRREAVNKSATILQQQQLISYNRGNLEIINRKGLESAACVCYEILKTEENSIQN